MADLTVAVFEPADLTAEHFEQLSGLMDGDRMVARAGLVVVPVSIGENRSEMVGFGGVIVAHDQRGQGLARAIMSEPRSLPCCAASRLG